MTAREEAARRFADLLGWTYLPEERLFFTPPFVGDECDDEIEFPAPDAPLHEHLAFVGRVAEAVEVREFAIESPTYRNGDEKFRVTFWPGISACAADAKDLSFAALLAACKAKEGRR